MVQILHVYWNMTWDDMGRKNVMRAIEYEKNQYIDFGFKGVLHLLLKNWHVLCSKLSTSF